MQDQLPFHRNYGILTGFTFKTSAHLHSPTKEGTKWLTNEVTSLFNSQGQYFKIIWDREQSLPYRTDEYKGT